MLKETGQCKDRESIRKFLAQVAYETGYYSTLGQPIDAGSGIIHMIPANWDLNVDDMEAEFPGEGLKAEYLSRVAADKKNFFKEPKYAWKSAAAWYKRTNRVIRGCGKDLFTQSYQEQTRCILGRVVDRSEAFRLVSKHIDLLPEPETLPPSQPPTSPPTRPPTFEFNPPTAIPPTPNSNSPPTSNSPSSTTCKGTNAWSAGATYWARDMVVFQSKEYEAQWWTRGNEPRYGGPWKLVRACTVKDENGNVVEDPVAKVCGGIDEWSSRATYNGGALAHYQNVVYKAKWWSRGTAPDVADSWSRQSNCQKIEGAVAAQQEVTVSNPEQPRDPGTSSGTIVIGVDNIVNVEAESSASSFSVYLSLALNGLNGKTAKDLEPIENSLIGVLEVQYGIFVPKGTIRDIRFRDESGSVQMLVEMQFPTLHAAEDAQAVMSQFEQNVRDTIKQLAAGRGVEVREVEVQGTSMVAEGVNGEVVSGAVCGYRVTSTLSVVLGSFLYTIL